MYIKYIINRIMELFGFGTFDNDICHQNGSVSVLGLSYSPMKKT